jgi:hypothetical protein
MARGQRKRYLVFAAFLVFFTGLASAAVTIDAVSPEGDDIDGFDITVSRDGVTITRDNVDSFERNLDEQDYTVNIEKDGYEDLEREINVEDEDEEFIFTLVEEDGGENDDSEIEITRVNSPEIVCRSQSFSVSFDIRNSGDSARVVSTSGSGFGKILSGKSFVVQPDQTRTYRFIFTDVAGTGEREFRVSAISMDSDSATGTVEVDDCGGFGTPASVGNIDMNLYPVEGRGKASVGELVRVKGFADGARGSVELNLTMNGEDIGTIQTQRDGYFQTYFRAESSGMKTITVSTLEVKDSETLEVVPKPGLGELEAPGEVFEGENFEICGNVDSTITPDIVLLENGEVIESRQARGEACFDVQAPEAGEYTYEMRVLTYGDDDSSSREVKVLEQGPEAESFPGQVSAVETEDGLVRVELYNTHDSQRNYTVSLEDVPAGWTPEPVQEASLNMGERESIYFYLSPDQPGEVNASLSVESEGEDIFQDTVEIFSTNSPPAGNSIQDVYRIFFNFLGALF